MEAQPDDPGHRVVVAGMGSPSATRPRAVEAAVAWGLGVLAAVLIVGPGFGRGSWFNLDLVVTPVTPVPRGVWALGPELPRRIPYALPLAWASSWVDSTWVVKFMVVVAIAAAVAGAWHLAAHWYEDLPWVARAGSGLLYGVSPFLLTRLGVGDLPLVVAMGLLPWAVPALLDPCRRPRAMFLWSVAIGLTGFLGGMLALLIVPIAVAATTRASRRVVKPLALVVLAQVPWLVPGAIVLAQGASPAGSSDFRTYAGGAGGLLRVLAGHGFWRATSQVGSGEGWAVPLAGVVLVGLAVVGVRRLPGPVRTAASGVAAVGLAIPLASALPLVRRLYSVLVNSPVSAILREGQRILPLYLLVLAPAAAAGAVELGRRLPGWREDILIAGPLAVALLLAGPGLWGINGDLRPVPIPAAWAAVRSDIHAGGGTTLSLPFYEYTPLGIADNRVTLDPMPIYLGGDVLSSSNPELNTESEERADPREKPVARLVHDMRAGRNVSSALAAEGIHWVVLRHDRDWTSYVSLETDPGLRHVVAGPTIDLFVVRPWPGRAVAGAGTVARVHSVVAPLVRMSSSEPLRWNRPGMHGWMRGWHVAHITADGVVALPPGGGLVWYWPALVALLADLAVFAVVAAFGFRVAKAHNRRDRADGTVRANHEGS